MTPQLIDGGHVTTSAVRQTPCVPSFIETSHAETTPLSMSHVGQLTGCPLT